MIVRSFVFRRCRACATLWVENPPRDVTELYRDGSYFENPEFGRHAQGGYHGYLDYLSDRDEIEAKFAGVLAHVEGHVAQGSLLDVGAGPGLMVSTARERGWAASGVDVNEWAVGYARDELGLDVRLGTLVEARFPDKAFDAVTLMDLVEHVSEPEEIVREVARVTRPGGIVAVLTPDAGSWVSRLLGSRWPEVIRAPEHLVLFSVRGLASLLERCGYEVIGWHSIGKVSSVSTLLADVSPVAPGLISPLQRALSRASLGSRTFDLDPRTKLCLYARRSNGNVPKSGRIPPGRPNAPPRLPKRAPNRPAEQAVLEDLRTLANAQRLSGWMFDQFADAVRGRAVEVGAGIGTFSQRILDTGIDSLLLLEPDPNCAAILNERFREEGRVSIAIEELPDSPALASLGGTCDFLLCQNVLEHIDDHRAAVEEMAASLRPGGTLALLVPADQRLYGSLDLAYGHRRRYSNEMVRDLLEGAGLTVTHLRAFNLLGVAGWWLNGRLGRERITPTAMKGYEALVGLWRPLEDRVQPSRGLSIVARAIRS